MLLASNTTSPRELLIANHGWLIFAFLFLLAALAAVRWNSVRRSIFSFEDPRTFAVLRILFSVLTVWVFANPSDHWRDFLSDEGLYTSYDAKFQLGRDSLAQWDPDLGFQSLGSVLHFIWNRGSLLFLWSSPQAVIYHHWGLFLVLFLYAIGFFTRTMGVVAFFLILSIYNRNAAYQEGTDSVFKCFWFLLIFAKTGHAWSVDNWVRCWRLRKKGLLDFGHAGTTVTDTGRALQPIYRMIPAWPRYLFIFQLTILYVRTGTLKFGAIWNAGDSLYYALNNSHFYRFDGFTQHLSALFATTVFRLNTWTTLWWERLFFLILFGLSGRFIVQFRNEPWLKAEFSGFRGRLQQVIWVLMWAVLWRVNALGLTPNPDAHTYGVPPALHLAYGLGIPACYLLWSDAANTKSPMVIFAKGLKLPKGRVLGPITVSQPLLRAIFLSRRTILGLGIFFHGFLIVFINLGLFPFIMLAIYPAFFTGDELCGLFVRLGRRLLGSGAWERFFEPAAPMPKISLLGRFKKAPRSIGRPFIAYGAIGTTVLSLAMGYHVLAVAVRLFQPPPPLLAPRTAMISWLQSDEWLARTRTWQDWGMFPSPPRSSGDLETTIVQKDGQEFVLPNRLPYEKKTIEFSYDRERKLRRRIAREDGNQFRKPWALFQCREWELKTGQLPRQVILHDISTKIPKVSWVASHGAYDLHKLPVVREKIGTFSCSGGGQLLQYMKVRRGLPLTLSDKRRTEGLETRLRRSFPATPYRPKTIPAQLPKPVQLKARPSAPAKAKTGQQKLAPPSVTPKLMSTPAQPVRP